MEKTNSYNLHIDLIRVLALSGVILIHTANVIYARLDFVGGINWWIANILNSASRVSVPLFILLSGSLILDKVIPFEQMVKRIAFRLLLPLVVWTCLYALWDGTSFSLAAFSFSFLTIMYTGKIFHLYFLVILSGLYFISPILKAWLSRTSEKSQVLFTNTLLGIGVLYALLQFLLQTCSLENLFSLWIPYTGLFIAGYVFRNNRDISTKLLLSGFGFGWVVTAGLNYLYYSSLKQGITLFSSPGCIAHYPDYFLSINVVVMALCAYLLLLRIPVEWFSAKYIKNSIRSIAQASFGMYLSHLLLIYLIDFKLHLFDYLSPLWLAIIIKWFVIGVLSYALTVSAMRIPYLKYVFGGK